jgi:hypothetical protein
LAKHDPSFDAALEAGAMLLTGSSPRATTRVPRLPLHPAANVYREQVAAWGVKN